MTYSCKALMRVMSYCCALTASLTSDCWPQCAGCNEPLPPGDDDCCQCEPFQVFAQLEGDRTVTLDENLPHDTLAMLKEKIEECSGCSVNSQRITFNGTQLCDDDAELAALGIVEDMTVYIHADSGWR